MTLGNNPGGGVPSGPDYPVGSTLETGDAHTIAASKIAHEFGHLDDNRSLGSTFHEQQKIISAFNERHNELTGLNATAAQRGSDPTLSSLDEQFKNQFGVTIQENQHRREVRAEHRSIPTIRQLFGKSLPLATKRAMRRLEKGGP